MTRASGSIEWTTFHGIHPRGQRRRGQLQQLVDFLTTFHLSYVKETAPGFSPTIYRDHYSAKAPSGSFTVAAPSVWRCGPGVKALTALVLDGDHHALDLDALRGTGNYLVVYTTWSHSEDDPRWRLVAPLAGSVAVEQQAALWRAGVQRFDPHADPACRRSGPLLFRAQRAARSRAPG